MSLLESLVASGAITLIALAAIVIEIVVLLALRRRLRLPLGPLLANAASGACLILALRAALLGQGALAVALWLGLSLVAHAIDLTTRLRP